MAKSDEKYFYAKGRRKTAVATVRLYEGDGKSTVNGKPVDEVYKVKSYMKQLNLPFEVTDNDKAFHFSAVTSGGGVTGQIGAIRLGIARALLEFDASLRGVLKSNKLLMRDPRKKERKKTGLRKARRAPQFSKR